MPNEETIARIEELRKICDPHEKEANLVLEVKQISDKILKIQKQLSELRNISDTFYYDEIQEARDTTSKAEIQRQKRELEKEISILEKELVELKDQEEKKFKRLKDLQQNKKENIDEVSNIKSYLETLDSPSAKENAENILKELEKKVEEDTDIFKIQAAEFKELQERIEQKVTLINELKEKIENLEKQFNQLTNDLSSGDKYINYPKKQEDLNRIEALEKELQSLQARQSEIVDDPIMLLSKAHEAALNGDLVSILNKIKSIKELLLGKPFMEVPADSIQEQTAKAIEERDTYFNQINGKNYQTDGFEAAEERIEELNALLATWAEEINNFKTKKEEIDNGTKYDSAKKINEINEKIAQQEEEVKTFESKESLTNEEIAALDKRKKEITAQKEILNRYFADQNAIIAEAQCLENVINLIESRRKAATEEIKELRKISKSLSGIDLLTKIKDNNELQVNVNRVKDLMKLPEYRRMLGILDEILDLLGKDIVVAPIEEQEENLAVGQNEENIAKSELTTEVQPVEEVVADKIDIIPTIEEENKANSLNANIYETSKAPLGQSNAKVVFEPAFEINNNDEELNREIDKVLSSVAINDISLENNKQENSSIEVENPFANIGELKTVESSSIQDNNKAPLKVESQEVVAMEEPLKTSENVVPFNPQVTTQKVVEIAPVEPETTKEQMITPSATIEPTTNSIDDFFAQQWGEVSNDEVQSLGKVA